MKTHFLKAAVSKTMLTLLVASMSVCFTACDKDEAVPTPTSLVGTVWSGATTLRIIIDGEVISATDVILTLKFSSGTVTYTITDADGGSPAEFSGTYDYTKPLLTITLGENTLSGAVDGNKMTIKETNGDIYVLMRK